MEMVAGELERLTAEELEPIELLLASLPARKMNCAAERPRPGQGQGARPGPTERSAIRRKSRSTPANCLPA